MSKTTLYLIIFFGIISVRANAYTYSYNGTFTNTIASENGTIVLYLNIAENDSITGYVNFTGLPGGPTLCAAGSFTGIKIEDTLNFTFTSHDTDAGCGYDWGAFILMNAQLLRGCDSIAGIYIYLGNTEGYYNLSKTAGPPCFCPGTAMPYIISDYPDTVCKGRQIALVSSSTENNQWSTGDTTQRIVITVNGNEVITLRIDSGGCYGESDTLALAVQTTPAALFTYSLNNYTANFTNQSSGANVVTWFFGDSTTSNQLNPTHTFVAGGAYMVTLIVTNLCGADTFTQTVSFETGVTTISSGGNIILSPNPVSNTLVVTVVNQSPQLISIYNLSGQKVIERGYEREVDVNALAGGIYFIEVSGPEGVSRQKFIKI